jgi:hypothetical protein
MDMEKLFERLTAKMDADRKAAQDLLAKMDANQAKAEAKRKTDKEEIRSNQAKLLATMEATQKIADAYWVQMQEMMMMHTNQAKAEVPEENLTVMPVEEPKKKRRRDRRLAAECCCHKQKILTRKIVHPRRNWLSPTEGPATVQQWHGKGRIKLTRRCPVARQ